MRYKRRESASATEVMHTTTTKYVVFSVLVIKLCRTEQRIGQAKNNKIMCVVRAIARRESMHAICDLLYVLFSNNDKLHDARIEHWKVLGNADANKNYRSYEWYSMNDRISN